MGSESKSSSKFVSRAGERGGVRRIDELLISMRARLEGNVHRPEHYVSRHDYFEDRWRSCPAEISARMRHP